LILVSHYSDRFCWFSPFP